MKKLKLKYLSRHQTLTEIFLQILTVTVQKVILYEDTELLLFTAGIPVEIRSLQGFLFLCHNGSICHCRK